MKRGIDVTEKTPVYIQPANVKRAKRARCIPLRYQDLDIDVPSDAEADTTNEMYYKRVHVASVCTEGGGWRRIDRPPEIYHPQRLLGFRWINFEDRQRVVDCVLYNLSSQLLDDIELRRIPQFQSLPTESRTRYYKMPLYSINSSDDTWLYEKLTTFQKVSRRAAKTPLSEIMKELEDTDDQENGSVLTSRDYLRKRVRAVAHLLVQQINFEKVALKGSLNDVYRCLAFFLLSCGKTEGLTTPKDFCHRQLDFLEELIAQKPEVKDDIQKAITLLNVHLSTYSDEIYVEDLAFKLSKSEVSLQALVNPPSADIYNISLERFAETVVYKELIKSGQSKEQVLSTLNGLFTLLVRQGDMVKLATCACAILSKIEGSGDIIPYHQLILERNVSDASVILKYKFISSDLVRLNGSSSYRWLTALLKHIPRLRGLGNSLVVDAPDSEALSFFSMILTIFGLRIDEYDCVSIYEWLRSDEVIKALDNNCLKNRPVVKVQGIRWDGEQELVKMLIFLLNVDLRFEGRTLLHDWSDPHQVALYIFDHLRIARLSNFTEEVEQLCNDVRSYLSEMIYALKHGDSHPLKNWVILVILRALDIPKERFLLLEIPFDVKGIIDTYDLFINEINFRYKWFDWCRFVNQNVSFHYRYPRIFNQEASYSLSYEFFIRQLRLLPPDSYYTSIVNGSTAARFGAMEFTSLANLCLCFITEQTPRFWLPLDTELASLAIRSRDSQLIRTLSQILPFYRDNA